MKPSATLATAAFLAVSGWAAVPGPRSVLAPTPLAGFQATACPTPAPKADSTKFGWKHGDQEYKDYTAAAAALSAKPPNPALAAQLAAEFVQKYPDSDYKVQALDLQMRALFAQKSPDTIQAAQTLIKTPGADAEQMLTAYTMISYLYPNMVQSTDPELAAKMATLSQAATCGLQLAGSASANEQAQFTPILTNALGFAQLNSKDYDAAIATLTKASQLNPKDAMPYYWMGVAEVTRPTGTDFDKGLFYLAKASVLQPATPGFKNYLTTVYTDYAGTTDGLQDVITAATNNATPPADFKVMSKTDRQNAENLKIYQQQLEAAKNALPPENTFPGIEARLKKADLAAGEWKKVKGQGYEISGVVTAVTEKSVDFAVGATDPAAATADVRLILAAPLTKHLKVGQTVTFKGVADSFKPNPPDASTPFLLTLNEGIIDGYSPTGKS